MVLVKQHADQVTTLCPPQGFINSMFQMLKFVVVKKKDHMIGIKRAQIHIPNCSLAL